MLHLIHDYCIERYFGFFSRRDWFQLLARYLLLGFLFYAPWAYGSTRPALVDILDDGLLIALSLHLIGLIIEQRLPRYPLLPAIGFGFLLFQSLWMCFNARSYHDDTYWEFVPLAQWFPQWPGSWDKAASFIALKNLAAMAGAFFVASDLIADPVWKSRLWRTVGIAGYSIILYGLMLKGLGTDSAISMYHEGNIFFGPYRYHANAGAYLNLIWPVLLGLLVQSWSKRQAYVARAFWSFGLAMGIVACFVNTSKASATIALGMLVMALFGFGSYFRMKLKRMSGISRGLCVVLVIVFLGIVTYGGTTSQIQTRWSDLVNSHDIADAEGRTITSQACLRMLPQAGWLGYGPGTFSTVFPYHTLYLGDKIQGFWRYAHEDYLQTVIEYGFLGATVWSMVFFGGLFLAISRGLKPSSQNGDRIIYRASSLALGSVALHGLVDFPLQVASIQLYVTVFLAYAWSVPRADRGPKEAPGKLISKRIA